MPLDLVHYWLKYRVKYTAANDVADCDDLTLDAWIVDSHDCLEAAVEIKNYYQEFVQA